VSIAPVPAAATELCPALSITAITPCASLVDPTSDLLQKRIETRLNIAGAVPDSGETVWAQSRQATFQSGAPALATTFFGADYRLGPTLLVGAMVQMDDKIFSLPTDGEVAAADAYFAGPYAAYRLSSNLVLGARASWGEVSDGSTSLASEEARLTTNRLLTEARLSGSWGFGGWQLMPTAAITYLGETTITTIPGPVDGMSLSTTRVTAGPAVSRSIDVGYGASVEPFAFFKTSFELADMMVAPNAARSTIGGGLTLNDADGYKIQAIGDYSETVGTEIPDPALAGKVLVSVPLN
jgi:hypothetical protein